MPLWGIVGKMGGGKTLLMTYFLLVLRAELKLKVLANYSLKFPYEKIDMETLLDPKNEQMRNCAIGLDEFWLFADSRNSASKVNKLISYILLQSRKRNVEIFVTAQRYDQLDKRFRSNADYIVYCKKGTKPNKFRFTIIPRDNPNNMKEYQIDGSTIYGMYDTNEIIDPTIKLEKHKMDSIGSDSFQESVTKKIPA